MIDGVARHSTIYFHHSNPVVDGIRLTVTSEELLCCQMRPDRSLLYIWFADKEDYPNNLVSRQEFRQKLRQC